MTDKSIHNESAEKETFRLEAFSDAVFAIAVTLLALELKVPHLEPNAPPSELLTQLLVQWPQYFALVTGFATILVTWVGHHQIFKMVGRVDAYLLYSNGLLLLAVTLFPFATALLGDYITHPSANIAVVIYAGLGLFTNVAWNLMWWSITHKRRLLNPKVSAAQVATVSKQTFGGIPIYLFATIIGYFNANIGIAILTGLWILWIVVGFMAQASEDR